MNKRQIKQIISAEGDWLYVLLENNKLYQGHTADGELELEEVTIKILRDTEDL